ncbi:MAG: hypothetical protein AAFY26_20625, partial [Cyanobacteria bacterium J06638_22]
SQTFENSLSTIFLKPLCCQGSKVRLTHWIRKIIKLRKPCEEQLDFIFCPVLKKMAYSWVSMMDGIAAAFAIAFPCDRPPWI